MKRVGWTGLGWGRCQNVLLLALFSAITATLDDTFAKSDLGAEQGLNPSYIATYRRTLHPLWWPGVDLVEKKKRFSDGISATNHGMIWKVTTWPLAEIDQVTVATICIVSNAHCAFEI